MLVIKIKIYDMIYQAVVWFDSEYHIIEPHFCSKSMEIDILWNKK